MDFNEEEQLYTMALTRISHFNTAITLQLYQALGGGSEVYRQRNDILDIIPQCPPRIVAALKDWDEPLRRAEAELTFCHDHGIQILCLGDDRYPLRLSECADAPVVLYYKGSAPLNQTKVINIIGTRQCTMYGADMIRRFLTDLRQLCPEVLIVSGLAYGVDINAHCQALDNGFETVGVLAHGLDTIYPSVHRSTAKQMVTQGGLLTEFMTHTNADKQNFVRRNRIVAGMSDACILVESAAHGGGMITADISLSYGREVFAFPGRLGDVYSEGCNKMIAHGKATLLLDARQLAEAMGWEHEAERGRARQRGIERSFFPSFSADQQTVVDTLTKENDLPANILAMRTGFSISQVTSLLFELEMMGAVKAFAGGGYHLLS